MRANADEATFRDTKGPFPNQNLADQELEKKAQQTEKELQNTHFDEHRGSNEEIVEAHRRIRQTMKEMAHREDEQEDDDKIQQEIEEESDERKHGRGNGKGKGGKGRGRKGRGRGSGQPKEKEKPGEGEDTKKRRGTRGETQTKASRDMRKQLCPIQTTQTKQ